MNDKIDNILAKYFSGEATESELQELDNWLAESEENEKCFLEMTSLYQKISPNSNSDFNADKAFTDFKKHIHGGEKILHPKAKNRTYIKYWAAAVALLFITISTLFMLNKNDDTLLVVADNQVKEMPFTENINITLQQNSSIEYQKNNLNEVKLQGEASFSINSKDNQNFTVYAGKTIIKDIGTVFTVIAYPDEDFIKVQVFEGEVLFFTENDVGIHIKENETGMYWERSNTFELIVPEKEVETKSETVQDMMFNAQSLKEVAATLQEIFHVEIIIENRDLENTLLTAHFNADEPLDLILNIIAETLSVNIINTGNGYKITK
jgi:Fe2+-dicitrate sensor, membrane component